jgi:hypothetical protein
VTHTVRGGALHPRDDLATVALDGELVVYDPRTHELHHLNASAALVWQHCDGRRTVDDIAAAIASTGDADRAMVRADVARVIADLVAATLLVAAADAASG